MVTDKQDILTLLLNNKVHLQKFGIIKLGLFGSFVNGQPTHTSDVDLLVQFDKDKKTFKNFMATANFTETLLGRNVDLLTPESLSPYIGPHIQKEVQYVQIS